MKRVPQPETNCQLIFKPTEIHGTVPARAFRLLLHTNSRPLITTNMILLGSN